MYQKTISKHIFEHIEKYKVANNIFCIPQGGVAWLNESS